MKKIFLFSVYFIFLFSAYAASSQAVFFLYTPDRNDGKTASGETFDPAGTTCAHATLPFGKKIVVFNGDKVVYLIVNDRIKMPDNYFAITDKAAEKLGMQNHKPSYTNSITDKAAEKLGMQTACIRANYDIQEDIEITTWKYSAANEKWWEFYNIKSDNLFALFDILHNKGYKLRYDLDKRALTAMYLKKNEDAIDTHNLRELGVNTSQIVKQNLEQPPLRQ